MPILLILLLPVAEIYFLIRIGSQIGFANTVFALVMMGILGAGLARTQGRYIISRLQTSLGRGEVPGNEVIHGLLVFVSGVLFLIPGFISDIVAFFLVLPGSRHLIARYIQTRMARSVGNAGFRIFTSGPFGGGFGRGTGRNPSEPENTFGASGPRDVAPKVIDVKPIATQSREKPERD